jgi:hypothetical protein
LFTGKRRSQVGGELDEARGLSPWSRRSFWAGFGFKDGLLLRSKGHHQHTVLKDALARADQDEAVATFDLDLGEQEVRAAVVRWLGCLGVAEAAAFAALAALGDWRDVTRRT